MKTRTLFLFTIVMFLAPFEILASDKETPNDTSLKTEEVVQTQKTLQKQQVKSQPPDLENQKAMSLFLQEKVLCEAQRTFDRSLSNISRIIDIFEIVLTALGGILALAIGFGTLELFKSRGIRKAAEKARDEAKEASEIAKEEMKTIREIRERAETYFEKVRKETPELARVSTEKPTEDYIRGIDDFGRRLDLVEVLGIPLKAEDVLKRGNLFFTRNEFEKAIIAYEKAIELDPKYAVVWSNKGTVLSRLKRNEEALLAYEKAIELDPKYAISWGNKGLSLSRLERDEEALPAYEKAIELDPKYAKAWSDKGRVLSRLKRNEEALPAYEKAIELDPKYATPYYNRACYYSFKRDKNSFIRDLKKSIELDPTFKDLARKDDDFKKYWDDDDFKRIVE